MMNRYVIMVAMELAGIPAVTGADTIVFNSPPVEVFERFANLIAAAERGACANVAKAISDKYAFGHYGKEVGTADEIEAAILARGTP